MAFIKIFREYGVRISNNESKDVLKHTDFYILGTLTRMSYKKEEEKWTRKLGSDPHISPIPPPPAPRTSSSPPPRTSTSPPPRTSTTPPQRVSTPPFIDTQTPLPEPKIFTPPPSSLVFITFEQVRDLVSSLSKTFISQF